MPEVLVSYTRVFAGTAASGKRFVVNVGGAGSSKSYSVAQLLIMRFLSEPNKEIIVTRKTFPALRATAMQNIITIMQAWGVYGQMEHNKSDCVIRNPGNGSVMKFISIVSQDDVGAMRIRSMQANYIWIEEANEITWQDFLTLRTRLRAPASDGKPNQIFLTLNPSDAYGWINTKLVGAEGVEVIVSTYKDNPTLDEEYKKDLESLKNEDETYYKIFALGVWATAKSIIYSNYDLVSPLNFPRNYDDVFIGMDFGYNNPSAVLFVGVLDGEAWMKEMVYQSHLTNSDLITKVKEAMMDRYAGQAVLRADEAEPDRIEEFKRAGFRIEAAPKGRNSIKDGIDFCKRVKWHIADDSTNLVKEVRGYKWKVKDGMVLDEPVKFMDHLMDAARYALTGLKGAPDPASVWGGGGPEWM